MAPMKTAMKAMKATMKKAAMKATMKKAVSMKAMKSSMKAKKVSKPVKASVLRRRVFNGIQNATKTSGGLDKSSLKKNSQGKIVSKKASAAGKKRYGAIKGWTAATTQARKELKLTGFVAINKGKDGVALYKRAKEIYTQK